MWFPPSAGAVVSFGREVLVIQDGWTLVEVVPEAVVSARLVGALESGHDHDPAPGHQEGLIS